MNGLQRTGILAGVIGFLLLIVTLSTAYTIDQGQVGVTLRNGHVTGMAAPGFHVKMPVIDSVVKFSTRTENRRYDSAPSAMPALAVYSKDNQPAVVRLSVNYHLIGSAAETLYGRFGRDIAERSIDPLVYEKVKEVYGRFQVGSVIERRAELTRMAEEELRKAIPQDLVVIEGVQIENIDFSDAYEHAIEEAMKVEAEIKQQRNSLEKARVSAEQAKVQADGEAAAVRAAAQAEAEAIAVKGKALRDNPSVIALVQAQHWDGKLPTTVLGGNAIPMLNLNRND